MNIKICDLRCFRQWRVKLLASQTKYFSGDLCAEYGIPVIIHCTLVVQQFLSLVMLTPIRNDSSNSNHFHTGSNRIIQITEFYAQLTFNYSGLISYSSIYPDFLVKNLLDLWTFLLPVSIDVGRYLSYEILLKCLLQPITLRFSYFHLNFLLTELCSLS